MSKRLPILDG